MAKRLTITEVLRKAVREGGVTLYRISVDTGLNHDALSRFMRGQTSMRLDLADRLAAHLGVRCQPTRRRGAGKRKGR